MDRFVEASSDAARVEATVKPPRKFARGERYVTARLARIFYVVLSSAFVAGVLVQVFFAGMGAFGANWSYHVTFVHLLELVPPLMVPAAFVGRLPWELRLLPFTLVFLIGAQYAFASAAVPTAALHPANGVLIFLTSLLIARRAWATARRKGA